MRTYYPGILMIPLLLTLMVVASMMSGWGLLPPWRVWSYWPVTLIATGLEEVYLWTKRARAQEYLWTNKDNGSASTGDFVKAR